MVAAVALGPGCSNSSGPSDPVAAIIIAAISPDPILVGATLQLAATAVNSTGGSISGISFTWTSSNTALATVSTGGLVTALDAGPVTITARAQGKEGSVALDIRAGGSLGTAGGVLSVLNGTVSLTVPANSLTQTVNFLIRPVPNPVPNSRLVGGTVFEVSPGAVPFLQFATLALRYLASQVPAGVPESNLQLYQLTGGNWVQTAGSSVNLASKTVSGTVTQTGTFAVVSTPIATIKLGGTAVEGALFPGQTAQLTATAFDGNSTVIPGAAVSWSSSDGSRIMVTSGGLVTAVTPGTATITASADGKSASTLLTVLAVPTEDWSLAVTDWATFQGNAGHTGYVAVILNPTLFSHRWTRTVQDGTPLNPVTTGPDMAFVSTRARFGTQLLQARMLTTGELVWSKSFGAIHGVHPPAYGSGGVFVTTSGHGDSFLWAFEANIGTQRFMAPYANQWSTYYAPVVQEGRVYMAGGYYGGMYAFDATTGTESWFTATNQYDEWTPAVVNGMVYAYTGTGSGDQQVQAVSAATGATDYEIADPGFVWDGWSMNTAPVVTGSRLFAIQARRLLAFDLTARTVLWQRTDQFRGAVTTDGTTLFVINDGALEARAPGDGSLLWRWAPPAGQGQVEGTTIVTRNLVFTSTATATWAIDLSSRRHAWSYPAGGQLALSNQGVLLIAQTTGKLTGISLRP